MGGHSISLSVCRDTRFAPIPGHTSPADRDAERVRASVIGQARFGRRCYFCDFAFGKSDCYEVHHADGDHTNVDPDNTVPVCVLCHAPHHLDLVGRRWREDAGLIIYLPEVDQVRLNNLLQAIYYAKSLQQVQGADNVIPAAGSAVLQVNSIFAALQMRARVVEESVGEGMSKPATLARVLSEMSDEQYGKRDELLAGLRYLAPEERLVDEARQWSSNGAGFAGLDVEAWAAIAGTGA